MIHLPKVTLICIDCAYHGAAVSAIKKTLQQIMPARTIFLTNIDISIDGVDTILIPKISSKQEYSHFMIKELYKYFETPFVLVVQHDGYCLSGESWMDEFYEYDFIGAPWIYEHNRNVGNGGFSLRSKRLCEIIATDPLIQITHPEDQALGIIYRGYLEETYGIKFPTEELADNFAFELKTPTKKVFGFHGRFHEPYRDMVIIRRMAAMGDVIQVEPVLEYFHNKGYRVVLETLPQFEALFQRHYFPVLFPHQIDPRVLATAKRYNLDMTYESDPKKIHLQAYFEFCGIKDYKLRNPKLSLGFEINDQTRMFKKYAILHIDKRAQPHRNISNIDWYRIVQHLNERGYTVLQLGKGEHPIITGAIEMNTVNENLLAYVCAGASLMIGIDSGISHICAGFGVPMVLFFGSVNPEYIHANFDNIIPIHRHEERVCDTPFCWSNVIGCEGQECAVDKEYPPCTDFQVGYTQKTIDAINKLIC